ncbi:FkbM family methyltransferase [Muricoccus nepalensis]|uniref:FkbM family methyltransferase n=1 Tax=Muricoccus nepalensis TaxID=1854500 RepID=UPI001F4F587F|nr:FkbM family methyltransferase [Roseomonas nepalensis]
MLPENPARSSFGALTGTSVPLHIVDVGANPIDGTPPYAPLLASGNATVLGFEPNPAALDRLQAMKGPRETYLPHAIGDGGQHTLHVCAAPGMTSLLRPNPAVLGLFHGFPDWGRVVEEIPVATMRLDDIPEARGADMLKIDIQGGELMAMRHAESLLRDLLVIQTEVEFLPLYADQPLYADVEQHLRARGFVLHRFFPTVSRVIAPMLVNNNIYEGMSQLVWADAIFVRDFTRPELFSDRQLLAAATILHDCYGSLDLVLHLLTEHDRRTGGARAPGYLGSLRALGAAPVPEALAA